MGELQRTLEEAVERHRDGQLEAALELYDAFIAAEPNFAPAHNNLGHLLTTLGRPADAMTNLQAAIRLNPGYAEAFNNLGNALRDLHRPDEALASYDRALALKPDLAQAHSNRGNALLDLGRPAEALAAYDRSMSLQPALADAHRNRGAALYRLNRPREAIDSYGQAIRIDPDDAEAHFQQSLAMLLAGDFDAGWPAYEWRKRRPGRRAGSFPVASEWLGERDISESTVLVYAEQGLGDTIQFCRFVGRLRTRCRNLVLQVQPELKSLMTANLGAVTVVDAAEAPPPFDVHCALMSLPLALGIEPDQFSVDGPYLRADGERRSRWRARLPSTTKPRVGVAWSGGGHHPDDRNRSIALERLAPLLSPDIDWVCLQNQVRDRDADRLAALDHVAFLGEALADFSDTAAVIDLTDLVICVDTSVAHLAGAMGKPVWILLPFSPDWRWGLGRSDTAWHPTARLFRQPKPGDWASVIAAVSRELQALVGGAGAG
ncbi:MAG: tetratricopeptide repeat protein [Caulobacterales bacterium]